jgi:hypothetical protein
MIWDLGNVPEEEAKGITLDGIYLNISASEPMTAQIIKEIKLTNPEALKFLPFNEIKIQEYLQLAEFDFNKYTNEKEVDENIETKNECPKCGYKW